MTPAEHAKVWRKIAEKTQKNTAWTTVDYFIYELAMASAEAYEQAAKEQEGCE